MARLEFDPIILSSNVRNTRQALGCDAVTFARLLEVPPDIVARYENPAVNAYPTEDKLAVLLRLSGATREAFLSGVLEPYEMRPPPEVAVLLASAPAEGVQPPPTPPRRSREDYKRPKRSRMIRGVCAAAIVLALGATYYVNTMPVKLNPNAAVFVTGQDGDFHVAGCPLTEDAPLTTLTVQVAELRGYRRCTVCIPMEGDV